MSLHEIGWSPSNCTRTTPPKYVYAGASGARTLKVVTSLDLLLFESSGPFLSFAPAAVVSLAAAAPLAAADPLAAEALPAVTCCLSTACATNETSRSAISPARNRLTVFIDMTPRVDVRFIVGDGRFLPLTL